MKKKSYGYLCAVEHALLTAPPSACARLTHLTVKEKLRFYKSRGHARFSSERKK